MGYPARLTGTIKAACRPRWHMADSWKSAKEAAAKASYPLVYHDLERGTYGACKREDDCGHFTVGRWVAHRAVCAKAELTPEEMAAKEAAYLAKHPESAETPAQ